jgi:hypothetical protein
MSVTCRYRPGIAGRLSLYATLTFCLGIFGGCLMQPAPETSEVPTATTQPNALRDQSLPDNGVPKGCTREWSPAANDSLLYCPDIRPPKPR